MSVQKDPTPLYSQSLLLQFMLNGAIQLSDLIQQPPSEALFEQLLGQQSLSTLDWRGTCAWGMSTGVARQLQLYYFQLIQVFDHSPPPPFLRIGERLQHLLLTLSERRLDAEKISDLVSSILESCESCGKDATLFFFLWRKHSRLDSILGQGAIASFFDHLFAKQLDKAHHYLTTSYAKKGYTHILPLIEENFVLMQQCRNQNGQN